MQFLQSIFKATLSLLLLAFVVNVRCGDETIPGGEFSTDSKKVKPLLVDSLTQLRGEPNGAQLYLHEIKSVTAQVVAGMKYFVDAEFTVGEQAETKKNCKVELWHQSWTGFQQTKIKCDGVVHEVVKNGSARRKRALAGGATPLSDADAEELRKNVTDAFVQLAAEGTHQLELKDMHGATRQVVAGTLYKFNAKIGKNGDEKTCQIEVWDKPWLDFYQVTIDCGSDKKIVFNKKQSQAKRSARKKRGFVGGATPVSDDIVEELRKNVTEAFVQLASEGTHQLELKNMQAATKQVVAGILYKFSANIGKNGDEKTCDLEVWDRPWLDFYQVTIACGSDEKIVFNRQSRAKRSTTGDVDSPIDSQLNEQQALFTAFKNDFERDYKTADEELRRYNIFRNNMYLIEQLNKFEQGTAVYGITEFADLTEDEYLQRTGLLRSSFELQNEITNPLAEIPATDAPTQFDWRDRGAVTPVKNQGSCGSCWAFSVTGNIEGLNYVKTGSLLSFSEQELLDCDTVDSGCNGGLPDQAYKAIETIGGLELEDQYPYDAQKHKQCTFNQTLSKVRVSGAVDFKKGDEEGMAKWLAVNGPISIGINANAMQFYRGGVSHPWKALCNPNGLDHGVLIVGYGVAEYPKFKKTLPYWIVKNSWGTK